MENFKLAFDKILDYLLLHPEIDLSEFVQALYGYRKIDFGDGSNSGMFDFVDSLKSFQPFAQLSLQVKHHLFNSINCVCAPLRARI